MVKDNRTLDEVIRDSTATIKEMGEKFGVDGVLPDNTDENRRRVDAIEKRLVEILRTINKSDEN